MKHTIIEGIAQINTFQTALISSIKKIINYEKINKAIEQWENLWKTNPSRVIKTLVGRAGQRISIKKVCSKRPDYCCGSDGLRRGVEIGRMRWYLVQQGKSIGKIGIVAIVDYVLSHHVIQIIIN
jgi:hypothetical protein